MPHTLPFLFGKGRIFQETSETNGILSKRPSFVLSSLLTDAEAWSSAMKEERLMTGGFLSRFFKRCIKGVNTSMENMASYLFRPDRSAPPSLSNPSALPRKSFLHLQFYVYESMPGKADPKHQLKWAECAPMLYCGAQYRQKKS